jgi:hypothetical protein
MKRLARDDSGAIVVFGVFFAVLVLGMLYYFIGIGSTLYYRERLQDAADASAFASAVVHARGMNTIALINMIMAAILSVLVTLRLIEALIIIAEVILYALSWLGGATAAVASALEVLRQEVDEIAEEAEPIIQNVLKVLHVAGNVIKVITPVGANLTVLNKVANQYKPEVELGLAIPPRFTLPVQDDKYEYLCEKAGKMAATLVMLPLSPILPSWVEDGVADAVGKLTSAGSGWFCGDQNSSPPSYDVKPQQRNYPRSQAYDDCLNRDKKDQDSIQNCKDAEKFEAMAAPNDDGDCQPTGDVCPPQQDTDKSGAQVTYEYSKDSWCGSEGAGLQRDPKQCDTVDAPDGRKVPDANTFYGQRLSNARTQCAPDGTKTGYWWKERELDVTWERDAAGNWKEVGEPVETVPEHAQHMDKDDKRMPCEEPQDAFARQTFAASQRMTKEWNTASLADPVCRVDEPKPPLRGNQRVTLKRREVTQVLGCQMKTEPKHVQVNAVNLGKDAMQQGTSVGSGQKGDTGGDFKNVDTSGISSGLAGGSGQTGGSGETGETGGEGNEGSNSGSSNMNPFRFEEGHKLGTSDMQIRSITIGIALDDTKQNKQSGDPETVHTFSKRVVEMSDWGHGDTDLKWLAELSEGVLGRFAVAQAEYFFDVSAKEEPPFATWHRKDGERDYLWYMGWTARMRRFRMSWKANGESADGDSKNKAGSNDNAGLIRNVISGGMFSSGGGDQGAEPQMTNLSQGTGGEKDQQDPENVDLSSSGPKIPCFGNSTCETASGLISSYENLFLH